MKEQFIEVIKIAAPWIAGVISSGIVTAMVKRTVVKYITKKIDSVTAEKQLKEVKKELNEIKHEIYILRGKAK